jgi:hypothetical protein
LTLWLGSDRVWPSAWPFPNLEKSFVTAVKGRVQC